MAIKKNKVSQSGAHIKQSVVRDEYLRFSFRLFDGSDCEICPETFRNGYTRTLVERLKDLSTMTVSEFTTNKSKALRAHTHDWPSTKRPDGFSGLNEQFRAYPGWQFCLTREEHGRVHGILIDHTFYVIWLDHDHVLYS